METKAKMKMKTEMEMKLNNIYNCFIFRVKLCIELDSDISFFIKKLMAKKVIKIHMKLRIDLKNYF